MLLLLRRELLLILLVLHLLRVLHLLLVRLLLLPGIGPGELRHSRLLPVWRRRRIVPSQTETKK